MKTLNFLCVGIAILAGLAITGILIADDAAAEDLTVDTWIPAKYLRPGDTMEIYAETSYISGVDVEADVYYYETTALEALNYYQIPDSEPFYVDTVQLEYGEGDLYTDDFWVGEFTIPEDADGGMYGVSVTASDGQENARDDSHSAIGSLMNDHIRPLQDTMINFRDGDMQQTMDNVMDRLGTFNDTVETNGGVGGVAHDVTDMQEWDNLTTAGKAQSNMSDAAYFLEALLEDFLQSDEYLVFENFGYSFRNYFFDMERNNLREEFTTSIYDSLMHIIGFDEDELIMSHIMNLENTGDIADAYTTLQATSEYEDWKHALTMISEVNKPFFYVQEMMTNMINLALSDEFMDLLDAFQAYMEDSQNYDPGNSPTQNLIYRATEMDGEEMENLMNTQEFEDWMAALNETSLKDVVDELENTMTSINEDVQDLVENSTQLEDLIEEMEDLEMFMGGANEYYDGNIKMGDEVTEYFDVPDVEWLDEIYLSLNLRIYEQGTAWVNITDPEDTTYEYEFVSNDEWGDYFWEEDWFDAIPGEWEMTISGNDTAEGWYEINFEGNEEAFMDYFLLETVEEVFFVQNAGIAVQAPIVSGTEETVDVDLAVYNGEGPLEDTEVNVLVAYGDPLVREQGEYWSSYGWGPGWGSEGGNGWGIYVNTFTGALLLEFDVENIELDDTVTFTLVEPDGTEHMFEYDFLDRGFHEETIEDPAFGQWDAYITVEGDDTGQGTVEMWVNYDPEPIPQPFWLFSSQSMFRIIEQNTLITDGDGIATLEIDVEDAGIYVYFVELPYATQNEYYAATLGGVVAVEFAIDFDLHQVGNIMGIPVYENPEGLGNTLDFDVTLSSDMDAHVDVSVMPFDFTDMFEGGEYEFDEDDDELIFENEAMLEASLQVNSPISLIGAVGTSPDDSNIQQYSLNFGFLVTSDTPVGVYTDESLLPGGRYELEILAEEGTPGSTYGLVLHESWIDLNSFDVGYFTGLAFAGAFGEMIEPEPDSVADNMKSIIYGEEDTGFADIPGTIFEDDFVMFTITEVENGGDYSLGVYFGDGVKPEPIMLDMTLEVVTTDPVVNDTITIKVVDENELALEGVLISITLDGEDILDVLTDSGGEAMFEVELPGTYDILATKDGFVNQTADLVVRDVDDPEERLQINLPLIALEEDSIFTITVVDRDTGFAIDGATVTVLSGSSIITVGTTNIAGQVTFTLSAGTFTLRAEKTDYTKDEKSIVVSAVDVPDDDPGLIPGFGMVGAILSFSGAALIGYMRKKQH